MFLRARASIASIKTVHPSVCLSQPGTVSRPGETETSVFQFSPYDSLMSLVFHDKISCRWLKGVLTNEGAKEGTPHKKALVARLT